MLVLARWIASYYLCTLWQALAPMLPPGVARKAITTVGLSSGAANIDDLVAALGRRQKQVVELLQNAPKSTLTMSRLKREYTGATSGTRQCAAQLGTRGLGHPSYGVALGALATAG